MKVSHSEAECFVRCSRQHYYSYGLGIQPVGRRMSEAAYRGIILHESLQVYFQALKDGKKNPITDALVWLTTEGGNIDGYTNGKIHGEVVLLINQFHAHRGPEVAEWQILEVESEGEYHIHDSLSTQIRPDLVARIPGKGYTVVDHKTVYNFIEPSLEELLPQLPKYYLGLREKYPMQAIMFNQVRYRTLKDQPNFDHKFKFSYPKLTQHRIIQTMKEHVKIGSRIAKLREGTLEEWEDNTLRAGNKQTCGTCSYKSLCRAEMLGDPTADMLEVEYQPKKRREVVLLDE